LQQNLSEGWMLCAVCGVGPVAMPLYIAGLYEGADIRAKLPAN